MLRDSDAVMKAVRDRLGLKPGETSGDGVWTFSEVECLGACANGESLVQERSVRLRIRFVNYGSVLCVHEFCPRPCTLGLLYFRG